MDVTTWSSSNVNIAGWWRGWIWSVIMVLSAWLMLCEEGSNSGGKNIIERTQVTASATSLDRL